MRRSCLVCGRLARDRLFGTAAISKRQLSCPVTDPPCDAGESTSLLAQQLLHRHRERQQVQRVQGSSCLYKRDPAVDALTGYGKTAVMARLAHTTDVSEFGVEKLLKATDGEWEGLSQRGKLSAANLAAKCAWDTMTVVRGAGCVRASGRHLGLKGKKGRENGREKAGGQNGFSTEFGSVTQRYDAVVPSDSSRQKTVASLSASRSWQVNMPVSLTHGGTVRGVTSRKELLQRQCEWRRVRDVLLSGRGGVPEQRSHNPMEESREDKSNAPAVRSFYLSPMFQRYCCRFGSGRVSSEAFMADPMMYHVLDSLDVAGEEELAGVQNKVEKLCERYHGECHV
ncbi:unnamed protein product [Trypanosoma congolense IL3000]|uniref:WGS project CAEQ00000000 data, annotated contig 534 n=1 Tax=Trypanosoma congolense (strain IL3000) TaxID=1068625 RepID=F9WGR8_TRYCI|nr:unnamed protein product [Trypanosoma congolense IL3000]